MSPTDVVIGHGTLLSKKGIAREGSIPRVRAAWAVRLPGRRGIVIEDGDLCIEAVAEDAKVTAARALPDFVPGGAATVPATLDGAGFDALALELAPEGWTWFAARNHLPAGLAEALAKERDETDTSIAALLARLLAEAGLAGYPRALYLHYRDRLRHDEWEHFQRHRIPLPLHLPGQDVDGRALPHEWAILAAPASHPRNWYTAHDAARAGADLDLLLRRLGDAALGAVHGLSVRDLIGDGFKQAHPALDAYVAAHAVDEERPLAAFAGNLPKSSVPRTGTTDHGMRPLEDLVSLHEALQRLAALPLRVLPVETQPLDSAAGRVTAEAMHAGLDVPGFDKSAMDGYAVQAADTHGASLHAPRDLRCVGVQHAGPQDVGLRVTRGTCIQIATGAPMPPGADAVVMVEATGRDDETVHVYAPHTVGQHIVRRGSDIEQGMLLVPPGVRLGPTHIAALAAVGIPDVRVRARPRVAVVSTGDEVVAPGRGLGPGQVHDANNHALAAFARRLGCDVTRIAGVPDEMEALEASLVRAVEEHDLVVVTGGTSAGARDLLPRLVQAKGEPLFHGIRIRPGKPVVAARIGGKLLIGLPGYPTSCLLVAERLLAPLLERLAGVRDPVPAATVRVPLAAAVRAAPGWHLFVPVRIEEGQAVPCFRGSAAVTSVSAADGFIEVAASEEAPGPGDLVVVHRFR